MVHEVDRGHRHDQDHHDLGGDQRHERHGHRGTRGDHSQRRRLHERVDRTGQGRRIGQRVGLRAQQEHGHDPGQADEEDRQQVRPGELREAKGDGHLAGGCREVRADDRADRRAPHDQAEGRRTSFRRRHVGGDVAAEVPGRVGEAGEGAAEEQQRDRADEDRAERDGAAEDPDREPEQQADPAAAAQHDHRDQARRHGGPDRRRRRGQAAERRAARHLRRDQRSDRHGRDVAGASQRGDGEEDPAHPPPQAREVGGGDPLRGRHRPCDRRRLRHARASSVGRCSVVPSAATGMTAT